jgi:hypothetical protein
VPRERAVETRVTEEERLHGGRGSFSNVSGEAANILRREIAIAT